MSHGFNMEHVLKIQYPIRLAKLMVGTIESLNKINIQHSIYIM